MILRLIRFPLTLTAAADILAGYWLLLPLGLPYFSTDLFILLVISMMLYSFGMVFNDICDLERDRKLYPDRPLPSGRIALRSAMLLCILLVFGAMVLSYFLPLTSQVASSVIFLAAVSYNAWIKKWRFPGALNMGLCRGLNIILGMSPLLVVGEHPSELWLFPSIMTGYIFLVTLLSTYEETHPGIQQFVRWGLFAIIAVDALFVVSAGKYQQASFIVCLYVPIVLWRLKKLSTGKEEPVV